jgi:hypothetical protein
VQNLSKFPAASVDCRQLELIGGEPLEGSGLETEQPDPEFAADEISDLSEEA